MAHHAHHGSGGCCGKHHHQGDHTGCCGGHGHDHGHNHDHHHGCGGGCGGGGCCGGHHDDENVVIITPEEQIFLLELRERQFLPMAQFVVKSSQSDEFEMVALSPVYLESPTDTMEQVRQRGAMLQKLEDVGLLTLDYDVALDPLSYEIYQTSDLFAYLVETVALGKDRPGHMGDTPAIAAGSIAITPICMQLFGA